MNAAIAPNPKHHAVMIVDDYPELLQTVARMLHKSGYSNVLQATNALDCIQLARTNVVTSGAVVGTVAYLMPR